MVVIGARWSVDAAFRCSADCADAAVELTAKNNSEHKTDDVIGGVNIGFSQVAVMLELQCEALQSATTADQRRAPEKSWTWNKLTTAEKEQSNRNWRLRKGFVRTYQSIREGMERLVARYGSRVARIFAGPPYRVHPPKG